MTTGTVTVDASDMASLERKLDTIVRPVAVRIVERSARYAADVARSSFGPSDTGAHVHDLHAEVRDMTANVTSSMAGAVPIEGGRGAGMAMPPVSALRAWAGRHGLEDVLFPIARAIARRGIPGRFFMRRARRQLMSTEMPRLIRTAIRELETEWGRRL